MSEKRISQVNELIRHEIAQFLCREIDFPKDCLVTVVKVETSVDVTHARVWISVLPTTFEKKVMGQLEKNIYHLQQLLNRKLVMRYVPKISFKIDHSGQKADRIDKLLDKIKGES